MTRISERAWRLLICPPTAGASAMAIDEALLEACAASPGTFTPVLRFYSFAPPCLSLGRFQASADVDRAACAQRGIDVVRRPSGGRAVLHERDLTYALVAPVESAPFAGGVRASARRIGATLANALGRLGVDATVAGPPARTALPADCFALAGFGEVIAATGKLAGSAQVRRGGAALQHGTVRLRSDAGSIDGLLLERRPSVQVSRPAALDTVLGRPVAFDEVAAAIGAGVSEAFGVPLRPGHLAPHERQRAAELEVDRYRDGAWTWQR